MFTVTGACPRVKLASVTSMINVFALSQSISAVRPLTPSIVVGVNPSFVVSRVIGSL